MTIINSILQNGYWTKFWLSSLLSCTPNYICMHPGFTSKQSPKQHEQLRSHLTPHTSAVHETFMTIHILQAWINLSHLSLNGSFFSSCSHHQYLLFSASESSCLIAYGLFFCHPNNSNSFQTAFSLYSHRMTIPSETLMANKCRHLCYFQKHAILNGLTSWHVLGQ